MEAEILVETVANTLAEIEGRDTKISVADVRGEVRV